jgi:RIO kinase 1
MAIRLPPPAPGQFDDAEDDALASAPAFNPREGATFIDEEQELLAWSDDSAEEEEEEEEGIDPGQGLEVDDEDWEIAERGGHLTSWCISLADKKN